MAFASSHQCLWISVSNANVMQVSDTQCRFAAVIRVDAIAQHANGHSGDSGQALVK